MLKPLTVNLFGKSVTVDTLPGVFSATALDTGTSSLLKYVPPCADGNVLDLGCGWGAIAIAMAISNPAAQVWAVDINPLAVQLTAHNAQKLGLENITAVHADDVPEDLEFNGIWSNPAIRIGKPALHAMLTHWLNRLLPAASAHLVVAKQLGAASLTAWLNERYEAQVYKSVKGYKLIEVTKS